MTDQLPVPSLLAVDGGRVVDHLLMTVAGLDPGAEILALAPMAVLPEHQRTGVGTALIEEGLRRAAHTPYPQVVVLGHPQYYRRFGFSSASAQGVIVPFDVPDAAWMALVLAGV